jgi:hypothetical protein
MGIGNMLYIFWMVEVVSGDLMMIIGFGFLYDFVFGWWWGIVIG